METLITRDEMSFGATVGISRLEEVALERQVEYFSSSMSWSSGSIVGVRLIHGNRLNYWKSIASRGSYNGREENVQVRKVTEEEIKSRFRENIVSTLKSGGDIDSLAVQKIFSNQEIRLYFPQLARSLPSPQVEMVESSNKKLRSSLRTGFLAIDVLSAMSYFNMAKTAGRYILPLVNPPQKMLVRAYISLAEGLVVFCQGLIENEKIFFEEAMQKMDESVDIIPTVNYPLKLFLRALLTEDESNRRSKITDARRISSEVISRGVTPLEKDLTTFFLKFVEG
jgi:hypothetical protein